jgi:hypothetical protein
MNGYKRIPNNLDDFNLGRAVLRELALKADRDAVRFMAANALVALGRDYVVPELPPLSVEALAEVEAICDRVQKGDAG